MANDMVLQDAAMLKLLTGMADKDDGGGQVQGPPTLKINYDPDSVHPRGVWVVGQKKNSDGEIEDEGKIAKGMVILLARNRWSYYNQKDTKKNCNSPFYLRNDLVRGNNYGHVCGKTCPMRDENANPRCKCQIVLFGKAITEQGEFIDCISYQGGASYMPVQKFIDKLGRIKTKGGYTDIPLFSKLVLLDSKKERNEGTTYFVSDLKEGPLFKDREQVVGFHEAREEVYQYVERSNNAKAEAKNETQVGTGAPPADAPTQQADAPTQQAAQPVEPAQDDEVVTVKPIDDPAVPDFAKAVTGT